MESGKIFNAQISIIIIIFSCNVKITKLVKLVLKFFIMFTNFKKNFV